MKETVTRCNYCESEITGPVRLLTFNGEEIDLCSDQCRLKWWMDTANEAEAADLEIHITSKPAEKTAEEPDDIPERNLKMLQGKQKRDGMTGANEAQTLRVPWGSERKKRQ